MRTFFASLLASLIVLQSILPVLADDAETIPDGYRKFVVTAYYSPLPDQSLYLRGSYEADKLLNGNGTNGASGKEVFAGMLAAPKTYAFGTRIELEGIGIGIVEDRGGAIVKAGERGYDADRIDIWMGSGEAGLVRALTFGKRTVYGRVLSDSTAFGTIDLASFKSDRPAVVAYLAKQKKSSGSSTATVATITDSGSTEDASDDTESSSQKEASISASVAQETAFSVAVGRSSDPSHVREVQEMFVRLGLYSGKADGVYTDAFYQSIVAFQINQGIIKNENDYGAGYYGPKTQDALEDAYRSLLAKEWEAAENDRELAKRIEANKEKIQAYLDKIGSPTYGETSKRVRELQKVLAKLGYFDRKDTAIFGDTTRDSLIRYQIDRGIISSKDDANAGIVNDATLREFGFDLIIFIAQ